jgi:invasion protein IalB
MSFWAKFAVSVALFAVVGFALAFAAFWIRNGAAPFQSVSIPDASESATAKWRVTCGGPQDRTRCLVTQSIYGSKSKQPLLVAIIERDPATKLPVLLLRLPLGVYLPTGVSLGVGDQPRKGIKVETCIQSGCAARSLVSEDEIAALREGAKLSVAVRDRTRKVVNFEFPGGGFAEAYAKLN